MKKYISILLLTLITGCGVAKKQQNQTLVSESSLKEQQHELHAKTMAVIQQSFADTSHTSFKFTIKPKGKFSYDPIGGYIGEAEYLAVQTNTSAAAIGKHLQLNANGLDYHDKAKENNHQKTSTTAVAQVKLKNNTGLFILIVLIAIVVAWLIYKKIF